MKKNIGSSDKIIRIIAALLFAALYFTGTVTGILGIILIALAAVFVLTVIFGTCPIYLPFGISTIGKAKS